MGPLKENLHQAVVAHLLDSPKCQTLLTALNHPFNGSPDIRETWAALKGEDGRSEGVKKQTGLQAVLSERPDLFDFTTSDRGHQLICLTEYAQGLVAETGGQLPLDGPRLPEARVEPAAAPCTGEDAIGAGEEETQQSMAQERPAKAPRTWLASQSAFSKGTGKGPCGKGSPAPAILNGEGRVFEGGVWNGWCYTDMYWTPEMVVRKASEQQKEQDLVKALYKALDMHAGKSVTLSQLGSDYKVAEIKKDPIFKNWRLLDFLREYDQVFELKPTNGIAGGMMVSLQPGAEAALPGAEEENGGINEEELLLPDRISEPRNSRERAQALRIELIYALHRRGGKSAVQDLGQEPRVQKAKQGAQMGGKKLVEWLKLFPDNFGLTCLDSTQIIVELHDADASDMSMIDRMLGRSDRQDSARDHKFCATRASRDSGRGYRDRLREGRLW